MRRRRRRPTLAVAIVFAVVAAWGWSQNKSAGNARATSVEDLFTRHASGSVVEIQGKVTRLLRDDNEGLRHQRFIVRLPSGHTVMIAHNIDIAERVPVGEGDRVEVRGQYEWNDRGGVLHWTHHDPAGDRPGGFIRRDGITYR